MVKSTITQLNTNFPLYRVASFTGESYTGNPAGVCLLNQPLDDELIQSIATELNLPETAFLIVPNWEALKSSTTFQLRWFSPKIETQVCGHSTWAAATILFREICNSAEQIVFETSYGTLPASNHENGICINFPTNLVEEVDPPRVLLSALGISQFKNILYSPKLRTLLIHLSGSDMVKSLKPQFSSMKEVVSQNPISGVIVTAPGTDSFDFVSRFFAPWIGVNEDPVTGFAHTVLAPYWSDLLQKTKLLAYQASARGGIIDIRIKEDNRVNLSGDSIVFFRGNIYTQGYGTSL